MNDRPCSRTSPRRRTLVLAALVGLAAAAGCDRPGAYGDASSIVAAVPQEVWDQVGDSVYRALEPTLYTVRDEKTFTVTHVPPADSARWGQLQQFRQLLLVGPASDRWIAQAVGKSRQDTASAPAIVQAYDVWARGQTVTVVLTPEDDAAATFIGLLGELRSLYDEQFRRLAINRMYVSGADTALADTLARRVGFRMIFPDVYNRSSMDSVYVFRNDNPDPSELIRQVGVTWRSPLPDPLPWTTGEAGAAGVDVPPGGRQTATPGGDPAEVGWLLEWRQQVAADYYADEQVLDTARIAWRGETEQGGRPAYEVQAVWQSPPDAWPAAGPFITRAIPCPGQDRLYLVDAWLYAPGKEKYQYMIQLETLLDTFECAGAGDV